MARSSFVLLTAEETLAPIREKSKGGTQISDWSKGGKGKAALGFSDWSKGGNGKAALIFLETLRQSFCQT